MCSLASVSFPSLFCIVVFLQFLGSSSSLSSVSSQVMHQLHSAPSDKLPKDILVLIFLFCTVIDLARFEFVDRFWRFSAGEAWARRKSVKATGVMFRNGLGRKVQEFCRSSLKKFLLRKGIGESNEELATATSYLSSLIALEELTIDGETGGWIHLCDCTSQQLHPAFASALATLVSLRSLKLRQCGITVKGLMNLALILPRFPHLSSLDLTMNSFGDIDGISSLCDALRELPNLQSLRLRHCFIGDTGFRSLSSVFQFLPRLSELDLSENAFGQDHTAGMQAISRQLHLCSQLRALSIGCNSLTPPALHEFFEDLPLLPSLSSLDISRVGLENSFVDFVSVLPALFSRLESLTLSDNRLSLTQWTSIAPLLPLCTHLHKLDLSNSQISSGLFPLLHPHLSLMLSLSSLNLSLNPLGPSRGPRPASDWPSTATLLARFLASLPALQELDLHDCHFDSSDIVVLAQSFPNLPSLRSLNLSYLRFDDTVVEPLIASLVQVSGLRYLDLFSSGYFTFSASGKSRLRVTLRSAFPHLTLILTAEDYRRLRELHFD